MSTQSRVGRWIAEGTTPAMVKAHPNLGELTDDELLYSNNEMPTAAAVEQHLTLERVLQMVKSGVSPESLMNDSYNALTPNARKYLEVELVTELRNLRAASRVEPTETATETAVPATEQEPATPQEPPMPTATFRTIALRSFARGERRILPIEIGGKNPAIRWAANDDNIRDGVDTRIDTFTSEEWTAVADDWVNNLASKFPKLNACVVAKPYEYVFIDCDTYAEFIAAYEKFSGEKFPVTYTTSARENRTQIHFRQTDATRKLGNVSQFTVNGIDLSVRQRNFYVLAEGSRHPSGSVYLRVVDADIVPMPDKMVALIEHLEKTAKDAVKAPVNASAESTGVDATVEGPKIPRGQHDNTLRDIARKLRGIGWEYDAILERLIAVCEARCESYGNDYREMCDKHAKSAMKFQPNEDRPPMALTQKPSPPAATPPPATQPAQPNEYPMFKKIPYPKFPVWVMNGTSIYEGFVKPYCDVNERIPYFMWASAAVLMMNYLGTKVSVTWSSWKPSFYIVLIGTKTKAHKSASAKGAMTYLEQAGVLSYYSKSIKNADGKSIVWKAGSPEGLGVDMMRTNCKNVVLFYDEFSALVQKAGIDKSSMKAALLEMYESGNFSNSVKTKKDAYDVPPNSYCATLVTCDTLKNFPSHWASFANEADGMDVRFSFLLQPEDMPAAQLETVVNCDGTDSVTRKFINKAVEQGKYEFQDKDRLQKMLGRYDGRIVQRAEKWALYFCIDLGLSEIDEDCVERGVAVAEYEHSVSQYLMTMEATSKLAVLQQNIIRVLQQSPDGVLPKFGKSGLRVKVNADKYDSVEWGRGYNGLIGNSTIVEFGNGTKADPSMVRLLRGFDEVNDE
jgi:hypothetical protein